MRIISLKGRPLEYSEALQYYLRTLSIFNTLSRITDFSQAISDAVGIFYKAMDTKALLVQGGFDQDVINILSRMQLDSLEEMPDDI